MQVSNDDISKLIAHPSGSATGNALPADSEKIPKSEEANKEQARQTAPPPPREELFAAVENLNQVLKTQQLSVRLKASEFADTAVIEVVDKETDKVIRQIPNESTVKLAEYWSQNGLLAGGSLISLSVDETA